MQNRAPKATIPAGAAHQKAAPVPASTWQPGLPVTEPHQVLRYLLRSGAMQAKLTVGQPGDPLEQEADRTAEAVMRMPDPAPRGIQRKCTACSKEEEEKVQTKEAPGHTPSVTPSAEAQIGALRGGGQPLPGPVRTFFEPRFGRDFSGVRVHSDSRANKAAAAVQARAFTLGRDIVFGAGEYMPQSLEGQKLLAHELAHTVQQSKAPAIATRTLLQRKESDDPQLDVWGGFRIGRAYEGDTTFIPIVRADLNKLNATQQGRGVLAAISQKKDHWYSGRIDIRAAGDCGFTSGLIEYNRAACPVDVKCEKDDGTNKQEKWKNVPNYVWLFHEIVHAYLHYVMGKAIEDPDFECMTVGLGEYFHKIPYNENRLRCELGYPVRPCYGPTKCLGMEPPACGPSSKPAEPQPQDKEEKKPEKNQKGKHR